MRKVRKEDINHVFNRSCISKANLTEKVANDIIDEALKERNLLLYYYKCQFCNSHHLTSKEPVTTFHLEVI